MKFGDMGMFHYVQKPQLLGFEKRVVTCNMEIKVCSIIFQKNPIDTV